MKKAAFIVSLLFLSYLFFPQKVNAHPVHISVTNIDILPQQKKIIFSVRVFISDFNTAINKKNNTKIDFSKSPQMLVVKQIVSDYINNNLIFYFDKKQNKNRFSLVRYKTNEEGAIWFYFEIPNTNCNFGNISIKNTLLNDLYKDQTNLLILSYKDKQQAYSFNRKNIKYSFLIH